MSNLTYKLNGILLQSFLRWTNLQKKLIRYLSQKMKQIKIRKTTKNGDHLTFLTKRLKISSKNGSKQGKAMVF
jgi:hypothetical protein